MNMVQHDIHLGCRGRGCYNITRQVSDWLADTGIQDGMLNLFVRHTSCSLMIQENADPDVLADMEHFFSCLVADGDPSFLHQAEGPDDMPAHIRMALTQVSLNVPVQRGRLILGIWQGIYLYEHRLQPMTRCIHLHVMGQ